MCVELRPWDGSSEAIDLWLWLVGKTNHAVALNRLNDMQHHRLACPIIAVTVDLEAHQIMELLRAGASDFAALPFDSRECTVRIHRVLGSHRPMNAPGWRAVLGPGIRDIIGSSPAFVRQLSALPTIAGCDAGVLVLGETGTGKEVFAEAIHYMSSRASKPWIAVNCGGIPADLVESELFGHARGAFTSALGERRGLIREAEGGTLFLDEVDSLPYGSQCSLLRFLHDKTYRAVGSSKLEVADVRVIAASNQNLPELAKQGRFRQDLFFRLDVLSLTLPPLRERREDIPELARHFVHKACAASRRSPLVIGPALLAKWLTYDWPGNVRELRHAAERAVLFAEPGRSALQPSEDLPTLAPRGDASFQRAKARVVSDFERNYLEAVLRSSDGNITQAAMIAGKNRRAFFELLRKHHIEAERFRQAMDSAP
jgi:two-component system, NtrC family, response regulator GlrR